MKKLFHYPAMLLLSLFLAGFCVLDMLVPKAAFSELENRKLAQAPTFSVKSLWANEYTPAYEEYLNDNFLGRDDWITLKSRCESLAGKLENNGVIFGADHYQFTKQTTVDADQYRKNAAAVAAFAGRHPGLVTLITAPSASLVLQDKLPAGAPFADENAALDEVFATARAGGAACLDLREVLGAHRDEYIFYRTDHHWTTLGAYYAYAAYCESRGLAPCALGDYEEKQVDGFYGTLYSKSKLAATLPDTITYYEIPGAGVLLDGTTLPLYDYAKFDTRDKYAAFLQGNNGFSTLTGGTGTGRCLLIKDSYANCFAPFMLANYSEIDVVDLRFYTKNMDALVEAGGYTDVLILYNFSSFQSDNMLVKLNLNL